MSHLWECALTNLPLGSVPTLLSILGCENCLGARLFGNVGFLGAQTLTGSSLSNLGVPPGRGNCPLTVPLPFDLIYTDYHGLQQMKQHMGLSFKKYR